MTDEYVDVDDEKIEFGVMGNIHDRTQGHENKCSFSVHDIFLSTPAGAFLQRTSAGTNDYFREP